jgi:hypothetical protein
MVVGIATGYMFDGWDLIPGKGNEIFLYSTASRPALGPTKPFIQWAPGDIFLKVKRPGHEAGHSPLSRAELKNCGAIPPLPHMPSWRGA